MASGTAAAAAALAAVHSELTVPHSTMAMIADGFLAQMNRGLEADGCEVKMLPTFVSSPHCREHGTYFALDLGGTNFRVMKVSLEGNGKLGEIQSQGFSVPHDIMQSTGVILFDFIANCIQEFVTAHPFEGVGNIGFTFSFPVLQTAIDQGVLIKWTKGFTATGVEQNSVTQLLRDALERKGLSSVLRVAALANDTVGTMLTRAYSDPECKVGVILGTGSNACYLEKVADIKKFHGDFHEANMVVNMEWGNFDEKGRILPRTEVDDAIDKASPNAGQQLFEKMVSGMYLGDVARRYMLRLHEQGFLFAGQNVPNLRAQYGFDTRWMSEIAADVSPEGTEVGRILGEVLGVSTPVSAEEIAAVRSVCGWVALRAARLCGAVLSAVLRKMGLTSVTVAVDGSVFTKYPRFPEMWHQAIREMTGPTTTVNLVGASDGSGIGAAIIAAVAAGSN